MGNALRFGLEHGAITEADCRKYQGALAANEEGEECPPQWASSSQHNSHERQASFYDSLCTSLEAQLDPNQRASAKIDTLQQIINLVNWKESPIIDGARKRIFDEQVSLRGGSGVYKETEYSQMVANLNGGTNGNGFVMTWCRAADGKLSGQKFTCKHYNVSSVENNQLQMIAMGVYANLFDFISS